MSSLRQWLFEPPTLRQALSYRREAGDSERYDVTDRWALNLYGFGGELVVYSPHKREQVRSLLPGMAALLPPCSRSFRVRQPGHHWVALLAMPPAGRSLPARPLLVNCGGYFPELCGQFEEMISRQMRSRRHAEAMLWAMLWRVASLTQQARGSEGGHPGLQKALMYLREHLRDAPEIAAVAQRAGISHNHLNRLCKAQYGCSAGQYLLNRRMELTRHLLCDSSLAVKEIAAQVGLPDLQQFNKTVRRFYGASPTALRAGALPA